MRELIGPAWRASKSKILGIGFLLVVGGLVGLTIAFYTKAFVKVDEVTLKADRIGNQLNQHADVKLRGVIVGEVRQVHARPDGADITMAITPRQAHLIPRDVEARILPKTLFGEKFVDLVIPAGEDASQTAATPRIHAGDVIQQDRSQTAIELATVLDDVQPILTAVEPGKLNEALDAVSTALTGRGAQLGANLTNFDAYLQKFNPAVPQLEQDISGLADVSDTYDAAAPDLLRTLSNQSTISNTLVDRKDDLAKVLIGTRGFTDTLARVLSENESDLIHLGDISEPILQTIKDNGVEIPYIFDAAVKLAPRVDAALGGTGPYLHIKAQFVPDRGAFQPTVDCPTYGSGSGAAKGPDCAGGATGGIGSASDVYQANGATAPGGAEKTSYASGYTDAAGSRSEGAFIASLVSPLTHADARTSEGITDVIFGPLLRGTSVSLT